MFGEVIVAILNTNLVNHELIMLDLGKLVDAECIDYDIICMYILTVMASEILILLCVVAIFLAMQCFLLVLACSYFFL